MTSFEAKQKSRLAVLLTTTGLEGISSEKKAQIEFVFCASEFVTKVFEQWPILLQECCSLPVKAWLKQRNDSWFAQQFLATEQLPAFAKSLRHFRQQQAAVIAFLALSNELTYEEVTRCLTQLAEGIIQLSLKYFSEHVDSRFKQLLVLMLGKLGAEELNFSSDIDLIFISPDSLSREIPELTRSIQKLVQCWHQVTCDGFVYRVDLRLRPFGQSGDLVVTLGAMRKYYLSQGRDWERYALMRGRVLGGSPVDRQAFYALRNNFVYRPYFDYAVYEVIRSLHRQITEESQKRYTANHLKLGPGGIREIEFIVQSALLTHGHRPNMRLHAMMPAFDCLLQQGLMPKATVLPLKEAYIFLRTTENFLQMVRDLQTHQLPTNEVEQYYLARSMGFASYKDFLIQLTQIQKTVIRVFKEDVLPEATAKLEPVVALADTESPALDEQTQSALISLQRKLQSKTQSKEGQKLAKRLLDWVQNHYMTSSKKMAAGVQLLSAIIGRRSYLQLLHDRRSTFEECLELMAKSAWISKMLVRYPLLLSHLFDEQHIRPPIEGVALRNELDAYLQAVDPTDHEQTMELLRHFKWAMTLRIAVADIEGRLPLMRVSDHLTALAETLIAKIMQIAWTWAINKFGLLPGCSNANTGMVVIAYGKLGGIEFSYSSDVDLVFLYQEVEGYSQGGRAVTAPQFYTAVVQKIMHFLKTKTYSGCLYEVDIRLRPSGQAGLLVSAISAFEQYQTSHAWTWEHQALLRARAICGDSTLMHAFGVVRESVLRQPRVSVEQLRQDVAQMRERLRSFHGEKGLKFCRGGLVDIEFIAQYLALSYARQDARAVKWTDTIRMLEMAMQLQVINADDAKLLMETYCFLRDILHRRTLKVEGKEDIQKRDYLLKRAAEIWRHYLHEL